MGALPNCEAPSVADKVLIWQDLLRFDVVARPTSREKLFRWCCDCAYSARDSDVHIADMQSFSLHRKTAADKARSGDDALPEAMRRPVNMSGRIGTGALLRFGMLVSTMAHLYLELDLVASATASKAYRRLIQGSPVPAVT